MPVRNFALRGARVGRRQFDRWMRLVERVAVQKSGPPVVADFSWRVTELSLFKGSVRVEGWTRSTVPIASIRISTPWDAMKAHATLGSRDGQGRQSFVAKFYEESVELARSLTLHVSLVDGTYVELDDPCGQAISEDPYHVAQARFFERIRSVPDADTRAVLEIGSRNRSGEVRRGWAEPMKYVGVDVLAGENVDVVCDAHELSRHFGRESFSAAFSIATFEHLAMPWQVVAELNAVLKLGAEVLVASHQTYPLHDEPRDFWRFSTNAWHVLFNPDTGFEVLETAQGEPASVVAKLSHGTTDEIEYKPAFLGSVVVARKTADVSLSWGVAATTAAGGSYPR